LPDPVPVNPALFPSRAQRLGQDAALSALLVDVDQRIAAGPVMPVMKLDDFKAELAAFDFREPRPLEDLLGWTVARLETGLVHLNHPRYLGLFNPAPSFPSQCADRIAAVFNPQLASTATAPAAVELEAHVIREVAKRAGLGADATGHFTSGGSEANATAVICALTRASPDFAMAGTRAFAGQPVFYISADSHLAWIKIAHQAGIGRDGARLVATDGSGRMCMQALQTAIRADREAGNLPFLVVATAGTTNAGMIDPLTACAEIADQEDLWFHADAAWGGGAIASEALRGRLAGIERADSVTIDAHKWFATTMGCGMFLTPHAGILSDAFNVATTFMPSHVPERDPYVTTLQWSRRFLGLRLFLSLAAAGWAGHGAHAEHSVRLIEQLNGALAERGWTIANGRDTLAVSCLLPPPGSPPVQQIVAAVLRSGAAWLSVAKFENTAVIRACVTHGETSPDDIQRVVSALEKARLEADTPSPA
jgi:glutamate/tyrosine decarboxylase-like PLP-dependent enzyme